MRIYCAIPFGESVPMQEQFRTTRPDRFLREINLPSDFFPAHMVYRVRGSRLFFASGAVNIRGGVMVIGTAAYTGGGPVEGLLDDIAHEIRKRDFEGVVLDNGGDASPIHTTLAARIVSALRPFPVYLPAHLATAVEGCVALVQTALSGGSLERHLASAIARYGERYVAVECDRLRMDFTLPSKSGIGDSIGSQRLEELLAVNKRSFFSGDLHVNYFTYRDEPTRHMVLFDDGESMRQKLALAERMGVSRAFMYYPSTYDIITELN